MHAAQALLPRAGPPWRAQLVAGQVGTCVCSLAHCCGSLGVPVWPEACGFSLGWLSCALRSSKGLPEPATRKEDRTEHSWARSGLSLRVSRGRDGPWVLTLPLCTVCSLFCVSRESLPDDFLPLKWYVAVESHDTAL